MGWHVNIDGRNPPYDKDLISMMYEYRKVFIGKIIPRYYVRRNDAKQIHKQT
jgi:hypothetical protein